MPFARLEIVDFRNLSHVQFEPEINGFNLIFGNNGSGKTSLLESIYYLSLGRSFRSSDIDHIVRKSAKRLQILAQLSTSDGQSIHIGLEKGLVSALKARVAGKDIASIAELASMVPVQLMDSQCFNLIDGGPIYRRKFMDWGTFYQCSEFLRVWKQYKRVLKQRNAALSQRVSKKEVMVWNNDLILFAGQLDAMRQSYINTYVPLFKTMIPELLPYSELNIDYHRGWGLQKEYSSLITENIERDFQLGYTQYGPHRADLKMSFNGLPIKEILSRGQQKLFVCAMILAQGGLLHNNMKTKPIYLIDDLPAELDKISRSKFISLLSKQEAQVFVTTVESGAFNDCSISKPVKLFHVEHGNLTPLIL